MDTRLANRLPIALFLLRLSIFAVFLVWVLDKFLNPTHTAAVFEGFYSIAIGNTVAYVLGAVQLVIIVAFVVGFLKTWSYGLVLLMHAVSTVVSFQQYLNPFEGANILFFAAWPMLAACVTLFMLKSYDTRWVVDKPKPAVMA
ncbi:MAG: hypothetical protein AAF268_15070 [Cyanobacteria bacterium P01_A01_bin.3]